MKTEAIGDQVKELLQSIKGDCMSTEKAGKPKKAKKLDDLSTLDQTLAAMKVGGKMKVSINGVDDQGEMVCVERFDNPLVLKFTLVYYGVLTGKDFVASKTLDKWEFK
jgi:hypothetical protein